MQTTNLKAKIFIKDKILKNTLDFNCELKEFLLNLLIFHIENDIHVVIPLNKYEFNINCSVLNLESENDSIEIHFDSPSIAPQIKKIFTFMQKSIYRQKFFLHKSYEVRACELKKCFKIEDVEIHDAIESELGAKWGCVERKQGDDNKDHVHLGKMDPETINKEVKCEMELTQNRFDRDKEGIEDKKINETLQTSLTRLFSFFDQSSEIPKTFLSSLIRFSDFMQFIVKTNKLFLLEKINSLCDYNTWLYLIENHKQILELYNENLNESSFCFTLSLFKNQTFEDFLRKDSLRYVVLSDDYQNFIKDLQDKITFPISKGLPINYKFILNSDSSYYPIIFNCISEILNYNFHFLNPKLFFKQYTRLLSEDPSQLIYLNQGITKIIKNCSFEMIFNEESKNGCLNRSIFLFRNRFYFCIF